MHPLLVRAIFFGTMGGLALLVLRRPAVAVGALLCTYVLEQWVQTQDTFFTSHGTLTNYAVGGLMVWALLVRFFKGEQVFRPIPPVLWAVLGLLVWSGISATWSVYDSSYGNLKGALPFFIAFGLLMPLAISRFEDVHASALTVLGLGTVLTVLALTTVNWSGRGVEFAGDVLSGVKYRSGGSPLAMATLAGTVALAALLMNFRGASRFWQYLRWGVIGLCVLLAFRTESRGQVFGMVIAGLALLPFSRKIASWKGFFATAIGVLVFAVIATVLFDKMAGGTQRWSANEMVEVYSGTRLGTSKILLTEWANGGPFTWIFGLGYGSSFSPDLLSFYPHLVMAEALGELGIVGLIMLWLIPILVVRSAYRLWPVIRDHAEARGLVAFLLATFFFNVILSFKQGSLLGYSTAYAFAIMIGRLELNYAGAAVPAPAFENAWSVGDPALMSQYVNPYTPAYADY